MRSGTTALLIVIVTTLSACGAVTARDGLDTPEDPDAPLAQIVSEGGFAPVEMILGNGPHYILLSDVRLICRDPIDEIFPGPLVPNYQVSTITEEEMQQVLSLIDEIGLPDITEQIGDS